MSRKQTIQIEITDRDSWTSKSGHLNIMWLQQVIAESLVDNGANVVRFEIKEVNKRK